MTGTEGVVADYEQAFARMVDGRHAISFGFARNALVAILEASGVVPGDEVILSALTCKVIPLALHSLRIKPVYVDIARDTLNCDPNSVASAIGPNTRAVLFQHTYGNAQGVEAVAQIAAARGVMLIEDCAQCLPYTSASYSPGARGQAAIFSNNMLKPLPAGSGGVAITRDPVLATRIRELRDRLPRPGRLAGVGLRLQRVAHHFLLRPRFYWPLLSVFRRVSAGYRVEPLATEVAAQVVAVARQLDAGQAGAGMRWLGKVAAHAQIRIARCEFYAEACRTSQVAALLPASPKQPLYYFPLLVADKPEFMRSARAASLEVVAWPTSTPIFPVDRMEDLRAYGYEAGACPVAERTARELVGLPTRPRASEAHCESVMRLLRQSVT